MSEQITLDIEKTIRGYLPQIIHMSLATCADNKPWASEVHFAYDDELNIYFCSSKASRHSTEIRNNPFVAGEIVTQHFLNQKTRCVSFEGTAEQIEDINEHHPAYVAYTKRFSANPPSVQAARDEGMARFYKITVSDFYVLDGYESSPPQKYYLPWHS